MRLSEDYSALEDTGSGVVASAPFLKRINPTTKVRKCNWAGASVTGCKDCKLDRIEQLRCVYSQGKYAVNTQAVSTKIIDHCLKAIVV